MELDAHLASSAPQESSGNQTLAASASPDIATAPDTDAIPTQPCPMPDPSLTASQVLCTSVILAPPDSSALARPSSDLLQVLPAAPDSALPQPSDCQLQTDTPAGSDPLELASDASGTAASSEDALSQVAGVGPGTSDDMRLGHVLPAASAPVLEMRDAAEQAASERVANVEGAAASANTLPATHDEENAAVVGMELDADFEVLALAVQYMGDTQVYHRTAWHTRVKVSNKNATGIVTPCSVLLCTQSQTAASQVSLPADQTKAYVYCAHVYKQQALMYITLLPSQLGSSRARERTFHT